MKKVFERVRVDLVKWGQSGLPLALAAWLPLGGCLLSGCQTPAAVKPAAEAKAIRINAGATEPHVAPDGSVWLSDRGFADGRTVDRGPLEIAGTVMPVLFRTERYGMTRFSCPVANGEYEVRLHFAETFARITEKGQRVFSVKVEDREIKDLDVLAKTGAPRTACMEKVVVQVKDGKLDITFTPGIQNPMINALEIISRPQ